MTLKGYFTWSKENWPMDYFFILQPLGSNGYNSGCLDALLLHLPGFNSSHARDSWQTVSEPGHGFCLVGTCPVGDLDDRIVGSGRGDHQSVLE